MGEGFEEVCALGGGVGAARRSLGGGGVLQRSGVEWLDLLTGIRHGHDSRLWQ